MRSVDVVIPTFDAKDLVSSCLQHLHDPSIAQITVVDDASTDGTTQALGETFPEVQVIELGDHRGLAFALNRGAEMGNAEFVLFLNNDVFAIDGAVGQLCGALNEDPLAASAGGRLVHPGTEQTQDEYRPRALPGLAGLVVRVTGVERVWPANPWTGQHLRSPLSTSVVTRVDQQPAGACLLVRRDALEQIGGWDESYWFWYEDVDLSRRLAEIGHALYVPTAIFEHVGRASTRRWARHEQHLRLYHGTLRYAEQHLSRGHQVALAFILAVLITIRIAGLAVARRREALSAYRHLLGEARALVMARALAPGIEIAERPRADQVAR